MALHLVSHMLISNRTAALFPEGLGSLAPPEKVGHAMWTFRVERSELGWSMNLPD